MPGGALHLSREVLGGRETLRGGDRNVVLWGVVRCGGRVETDLESTPSSEPVFVSSWR